MMGDIYARAEKVLACVGPHADDSKFLMRTFRRNQGLYSLLSKNIEYKYMSLMFDADTRPMPTVLKGPVCCWLLRYSFSTSRGQKFLHAHNRFFARPYFSRLWVVQEVFMGREVMLWCGSDHIPFDLLAGHLGIMCRTLKLAKSDLPTAERDWGYSRFWKGSYAWRMSSRLYCNNIESLVTRSALVELDIDRGSIRTINRDLARVHGFECENPLDKFYGMLALIAWSGQKPIVPDYQKSTFQLALELLGKEWADDTYYDIRFRAAWLVENFRLDKSNWRIRERLDRLSPRVAGPGLPMNDDRVCHKICGYGYPIVSKRPDVGQQSHQFYIRAPGRSCRRSPFDGRTFHLPTVSGETLYGPLLDSAEMEEGDWIIQLRMHGADVNLGVKDYEQAYNTYFIIARPDTKVRFELIGYTTSGIMPKLFHHYDEEFNFYLDSEDLLMVAVHHNHWRHLLKTSDGEIEKESLFQLWSQRICRFPGSSFAMREPHSPRPGYGNTDLDLQCRYGVHT